MRYFDRFVLIVALALLLFIASRAAENGRYQLSATKTGVMVDTRTGELYAAGGGDYGNKWELISTRTSEAVRPEEGPWLKYRQQAPAPKEEPQPEKK
jgi:hypothetical protein